MPSKPFSTFSALMAPEDPTISREVIVVASGLGTVDVQPVGSGMVIRNLPLIGGGSPKVGDRATMQLSGGRRVVFAAANPSTTTIIGSGAIGSTPPTTGDIASILAWQADHLAAADPHPQYLLETVAAATYVPLTRSILAGNGMTQNYTTLANDITLAVGVANTGAAGLTVEADAVRLTSSANPGAAEMVLASTAAGYLQLVRLGVGTAPATPLHAAFAGPQLRLEADALYPADFEADSQGNIWLQPYGDVILDPGLELIRPANNRTTDMGSNIKQFMTFWAAEARFSTLVAEDLQTTIGGRLYVAVSNMTVSPFTAAM